MSQYLDRKQVIDLYEKFQPSLATHVIEFGGALRKLPVTQDSHGEWMREGQRYRYLFRCTNCNTDCGREYDFCPNCGASMVKKEGEHHE